MAFYRTVFELADTPRYDEATAQLAVLLPSHKEQRAPGVSLVRSPAHTPGPQGAVVNFHLGDHAALRTALLRVEQHGGRRVGGITNEGDGQRFCLVLDSEGNRLALSSFEALEP